MPSRRVSRRRSRRKRSSRPRRFGASVIERIAAIFVSQIEGVLPGKWTKTITLHRENYHDYVVGKNTKMISKNDVICMVYDHDKKIIQTAQTTLRCLQRDDLNGMKWKQIGDDMFQKTVTARLFRQDRGYVLRDEYDLIYLTFATTNVYTIKSLLQNKYRWTLS